MPDTNDHGDKLVLGAYDPACLLSLSGVVAATLAMVFAAAGAIELALVGLILAGLADLFDGMVARRLKRGTYAREFGVQLDTTVDAVAFVAAPVVIALNSAPATWPVIAGVVPFVVAGVVRLAHFNTLTLSGADQSSHHRGLPVTYTALVFPLLFVVRDAISADDFQRLLGLCFAVIGVLFVINVPVRKPRGGFYVILPALTAGLIVYWVGRYLQSSGGI